jgi:hypothetical protein
MPWYEKSMKDATTCDKLRIGGNNLRPGDFRIGQPAVGNAAAFISEYIGYAKTTQGTETSKYLEEEKTIVISLVVASEKERV